MGPLGGWSASDLPPSQVKRPSSACQAGESSSSRSSLRRSACWLPLSLLPPSRALQAVAWWERRWGAASFVRLLPSCCGSVPSCSSPSVESCATSLSRWEHSGSSGCATAASASASPLLSSAALSSPSWPASSWAGRLATGWRRATPMPAGCGSLKSRYSRRSCAPSWGCYSYPPRTPQPGSMRSAWWCWGSLGRHTPPVPTYRYSPTLPRPARLAS
mmetsp:Transcript_5339/g.11514  ORF Transcript_5339/g.11514 Transcript_5339/m.11514 type:complete len:217 (-) Transcript_5339:559-1209(-)